MHATYNRCNMWQQSKMFQQQWRRGQVGASNELPESEELDALYDRFLIRKRVSQVSMAGLPGLLSTSRTQSYDSRSPSSNGANGNGAAATAGSRPLSEGEIRKIRYGHDSPFPALYSGNTRPATSSLFTYRRRSCPRVDLCAKSL